MQRENYNMASRYRYVKEIGQEDKNSCWAASLAWWLKATKKSKKKQWELISSDEYAVLWDTAGSGGTVSEAGIMTIVTDNRWEMSHQKLESGSHLDASVLKAHLNFGPVYIAYRDMVSNGNHVNVIYDIFGPDEYPQVSVMEPGYSKIPAPNPRRAMSPTPQRPIPRPPLPSRGRIPALGALLVLAAVASLMGVVAATPAAAGEYTVLQCGAGNRGFDDAGFDRTNGADYNFGKHCSEPSEANALQIRSVTSAPQDREGRIAWVAPAGTRLVGASLEASLRADSGHRPRLQFLGTDGNANGVLATGSDQPAGFGLYAQRPGDRAGFAATLGCEAREGCRQSDQARAWIREVRLTLRDDSAPGVTPSGSLLGPGWQRGTATLAATLADQGSGLRSASVTVNSRPVGMDAAWPCATLAGGLAARLQPCATDRAIGAPLDTSAAPFVNGANVVRICAADFGGGSGCVQRAVAVDNAPPFAAFDGPPDPDDPELITASAGDLHSGLASASISYRALAGGEWHALPISREGGRLSARVDSEAEPPGRYLFRIDVADVAGNLGSSTARRDGEQMVLSFPLKTATSVRAKIAGPAKIGYGKSSSLVGRLSAARGPAAAGQPVVVVERFDAGSEPGVRRRTVRTDRDGRFELRLPPGPSRHVVAGYGGSPRYIGSAARPDYLVVSGRATLKVSRHRVRPGGRVRFSGSVGTAGTRLPAAGKIVELQARERGERRFRTVRQATRTDSRGRFSTSYRFGRFYRRTTRFQFRLKARGETGWPYAAPTISRPRRLTVAR